MRKNNRATFLQRKTALDLTWALANEPRRVFKRRLNP
jgi:hypothetical protein